MGPLALFPASATANATLPPPAELQLGHAVSRVSGVLSLVVWLFAQLPQVLENYANESVAGISAAFLACWIGGDATNLAGCVLTRALPFQTCLAAYYCFVDVVLALQFWYYTRVYPRQRVHHNMLQSPDMRRPVHAAGPVKHTLLARLNRFEHLPTKQGSHRLASSSGGRRARRPRRSFLQLVLAASVLSSTFGRAQARVVEGHDSAPPAQKTLSVFAALCLAGLAVLALLPRYSPALVGMCSGWLSTCLYVCSRTPQLLKNYRSKSTAGVSPLLFVFAMSGNILYTVSVGSDLYLLAKYEQHMGGPDFRTVCWAQAPFLVGSMGTVVFDAAILLQFWLYRKRLPMLKPISPGGWPALAPKSLHSDAHFTKPDWYTNNFQAPAHEVGFSFDDHRHDHIHELRDEPRDERSLLINDPYVISPPRHYVVASSHSSVARQPRPRRGLSETFSAFARSLSNSPAVRPPSVVSLSVFGHNATLLGTALLPLLVNTYSSISKKMAHDSRTPFLPIDFLHDGFMHQDDGLADDAQAHF